MGVRRVVRHVGGVAVLFKPGHSASHITPATRKGRSAYAEDRLMIAAIAFNRGNSVLYVINVYGHSGAGREEEREKPVSYTHLTLPTKA